MTAVLRVLVLGGLCVGVAAWAADPPAGDLKSRQAQNAEQFRLIKDQLLKLAQKLAVSDKPAERERAKVILAAVELATRENLDGQFRALVGELSKDQQSRLDLDRAVSLDGQLQKALQDMLSLLLTDDEAVRTKAEIKRTAEALKEARDIVRAEETLRAMTDNAKTDEKKLAKAQKDLADRTKALADRMAGQKDDKATDPKAGDKKSKDGKKSSDPKDGKKGEGKDTDGKSNDGKSGEPKDGKAGEPKDGKKGEGKDGKSADEKSKDGKPGEPKDGKSSDAKPKDGKPGEPKDGKPGEPKDGKSGKSPDGKPSQPKDGKQSDGQPKDGQQQQQQQGEQQQQQQMPGRERIQEAVPRQERAANDLDENKRDQAAPKQDEAIKKLNEAIKELEKRLKQLREEEALRQLAGLEARCNRMLQLQTAVYEATKGIDAAVQKAGGKKDTADYQKAQAQADKEREIVLEADKTLDLLKAEGSAVAFAGVMQEVRVDMAGVQQRLTGADVGPVTQEMQASIIALLKEMAAALKKQQQDMQQQQQQQQQNQQGGPQPNQALVNKIVELKLIRSLQTDVNNRTKLVGAKSPGEQTADPRTAADLRAIAARQVRIQEMLTALATGANQ